MEARQKENYLHTHAEKLGTEKRGSGLCTSDSRHAQNQTWREREREREREAMYKFKLARDKPDIEPHMAD